jgi:hypothetical protein
MRGSGDARVGYRHLGCGRKRCLTWSQGRARKGRAQVSLNEERGDLSKLLEVKKPCAGAGARAI